MISSPSSSTCQPIPHAPSVGDSQLSSSKRISCSLQIDPDRAEALQVDVLHVRRATASGSLEIVSACTAGWDSRRSGRRRADGSAARSHAIRMRAEHAQKCFRVHGAGADFHIVWLLQHATLLHPEMRELQN